MRSTAEIFRSKLVDAAIPFHALTVNASMATVTCNSKVAADRWHALFLQIGVQAFSVRETFDCAKINRGTNLQPSTVKRWLTGCRFAA